MKIVIVANIPNNCDALFARPGEHGKLRDLRDLLNYGPQPEEVVVNAPGTFGLSGLSEPVIDACRGPLFTQRIPV
jgi:hypothetical protein